MTICHEHEHLSPLDAIRRRLRRWRQERAERKALHLVASKPYDRLLEDAGLSRHDIDHLTEQRRLHTIADWGRWRRPGL